MAALKFFNLLMVALASKKTIITYEASISHGSPFSFFGFLLIVSFQPLFFVSPVFILISTDVA
ncbi:hypothetical protein ERO13_D11G104750v2 [Gossypium hirsutum]|uniref:Uncharacterized protein n=1 Tax=Gossypium darwinii TaxID=34276 RepID=A0A5D2AJK4_GOSDA|nr:hypothetical protein ERO13_D11G104750v2 [Gossypium hirsutum]TYG44689.1 hypothetical protein ES288_D11G115800v1 [Gossypium darwinii]